jgi:FAD/FMN-containing dehydrogenase
LLTFHTPQGIEASARSFRGLIDLAIARGGSYYLTYHKFAKQEQVMACYPQFKQFLELKRKYDPTERFQSDWYRHYQKLFTS